jgi:plasmid maintenance system antidote protein VapI
MANLDKLNKIVSGKSEWLEKAKKRQENKEWLRHSQKIAVKVLRTLRKNKADKTSIGSQKELAIALGVSPQQINKIVKGRENLTLETISKLEQALNISLISANNIAQTVEYQTVIEKININTVNLKDSFSAKIDFSDHINFLYKGSELNYNKLPSKEIYTSAGENHLKIAS